QAVFWFRKTAERGDTISSFRLAQCLERGDGAEKNIAQAVKWYQAVAEAGHVPSQRALAQHYLGESDANPALAFQWLLEAARHNESAAYFDLAKCYTTGAGTEKNPKEALTWYLKAASIGARPARPILARAYQDGVGTEK